MDERKAPLLAADHGLQQDSDGSYADKQQPASFVSTHSSALSPSSSLASLAQAAHPQPPAAVAVVPSPQSAALGGGELTLWSGDKRSATAARHLVYFEGLGGERQWGTLRWCAPGRRLRVDGQAIPLHLIDDVRLGRQSAALQSPQARAAAVSSRCFVLQGQGFLLSAQCDSDSERKLWLKAFKAMYTQAGAMQAEAEAAQQAQQKVLRRFM